MDKLETYTAFEGCTRVAHGTLNEVILKIKKIIGKAGNSSILIFSDATGATFDFNFQGSEKDVLRRLEIFVGKE